LYEEKERANYQYRLGISLTRIWRTVCIKDLEVHVDSKLRFHHHVDFPLSHAMKLLASICTITYSLSTVDIIKIKKWPLLGLGHFFSVS
jgi:hypothetical protein